MAIVEARDGDRVPEGDQVRVGEKAAGISLVLARVATAFVRNVATKSLTSSVNVAWTRPAPNAGQR